VAQSPPWPNSAGPAAPVPSLPSPHSAHRVAAQFAAPPRQPPPPPPARAHNSRAAQRHAPPAQLHPARGRGTSQPQPRQPSTRVPGGPAAAPPAQVTLAAQQARVARTRPRPARGGRPLPSQGPRVREPARTVHLPQAILAQFSRPRRLQNRIAHDSCAVPRPPPLLLASPPLSASPAPSECRRRRRVHARRTRCAASLATAPPSKPRPARAPSLVRRGELASFLSLPHFSPLDVLLARHG
jgi:hypothetical protein